MVIVSRFGNVGDALWHDEASLASYRAATPTAVLTEVFAIDVTSVELSECSVTARSASGKSETRALAVCLSPWTHYTVSVRALSSDDHHGLRIGGEMDTLADGALGCCLAVCHACSAIDSEGCGCCGGQCGDAVVQC